MTTDIDRLDFKSSDHDVEKLNAFDILVCDKVWQQRELLPEDDADYLWYIIEKWHSKGISSTEALAWLESRDLLDPDALMMGFSAFYTSGAAGQPVPPTILPPAAPGGALRPYSGVNEDVLEILAVARHVA